MLIRGGVRGGKWGWANFEVDLQIKPESRLHKRVKQLRKMFGTPMSRPRSQFNAVQLQVAIGLGWWVLGKTDFSSSSHHLIKMMKNRRRGQWTNMINATTVHWRGKIYLLAQYKCYSDMSGKSLQCLCI